MSKASFDLERAFLSVLTMLSAIVIIFASTLLITRMVTDAGDFPFEVRESVESDEVEARVIKLPEISGRWYLTAIYSQWDGKSRQLYNMFRNNRELNWLARNTVFNEWGPGSQMANSQKWRQFLGDSPRPALILQAPPRHGNSSDKGEVVYFGNGSTIKLETLAADIQSQIKYHTSRCPVCPRSPDNDDPSPPDTPSPTVVPLKPTTDEKSDEEPEEPEEVSEEKTYIPLWAFLFPVAGAGLGLYTSIKQERQ